MAAKTILFFCAQALLAQIAFTQCIGSNAYTTGINTPFMGYDGLAATDYGMNGAWGYDGAFTAPYGAYGSAYGAVAPAFGVAANGGGLPIASTSPIAPSGLMVRSDNKIEGILAVTGQLPFLSAVALEGALPTAGSGSIAYGCGDGTIGIVSELDIVGNAYVGGDLGYGAAFPAGAFNNYLGPRAACGCGL